MIIDLHKYLIFGNRQEMDHFFVLAQRAGFMEFIGRAHKRALELPEMAKKLLAAIKIAKHHPVHPRELPPSLSDPEKLAEKITSLHREHEGLLEEERILTAEIARIAVFGDFSRSELDHLERDSKRVFQFFCMKSDLARETALPPEVIYVGTEYDLDYFVSINKERIQYPKMIEILIDRPVGALRDRLLLVREEMGKTEGDLRTYANALPILEKGLIECLNEHHLQLAKHDAAPALNDTLFMIEAWVPKTRIKALYALLSTLNVDCTEIAIESKDQIPTCMENRGVSKIGEDLVKVYDVPAHTDKDPSTWVFVFFSIFFAMIISDAGYGFLFLILTLILKWKFRNLEGAGKRFIKMSFILSSTCIIWGVATSSYFGIEIGPSSPLRKFTPFEYLAVKKAEYHLERKDDVYEEFLKKYPALSQAKNGEQFLSLAATTDGSRHKYEALDLFYDNLFMESSFLIGIFHISLAFLRYLRRNWAGIGWIFFMIGGYLYFPSIVNATIAVNFMGWMPKAIAHSIGLQMTIAGLAIAFVAALIQKKWGAITELLHVIQIFADVLSYLRIYALSLAGIVVARTFNDHLGLDLGMVVTVCIILIGHIININLCIMGGVIHGLRLNFLEWYHYCFEGGGRLFNPLRIRRSR